VFNEATGQSIDIAVVAFISGKLNAMADFPSIGLRPFPCNMAHIQRLFSPWSLNGKLFGKHRLVSADSVVVSP
jgi:hypothetical protein